MPIAYLRRSLAVTVNWSITLFTTANGAGVSRGGGLLSSSGGRQWRSGVIEARMRAASEIERG
jgi:hypothetical protein